MTVTIRDVAKKANVSVATVSRVLNGTAKVSDEARNAVLAAQSELGFYLNANARTLAKKDSETIGVLVSDISDPYFGTMIKSCDMEANAMGKSLLIAQGFYDPVREQKAIDSLLSHQCSGMLVHALAIDDIILSDYMRRFPYIVLINRRLRGFEDRCVIIDNHNGMYDLTNYLIKFGHKKIAYVTSSFGISDAQERFSGFKKACADNNIEINPRLILSVPPSLEGGKMAAEQLMKIGIDQFSVVMCYCDTIAASAMSTFENNGIKIPDDISITGFDDLFIASCLNPALTTVTNPIGIMGKEALKLSLARYKKDYDFTIPQFKTELIIRKSVQEIKNS
ncbi:LacI family DNA-binding transcriptional regulator [Succinivibrio dextrinosolvens]|jgi:LacI family transcriptional regulator|uniref:Transcriptional regulator, LacI family n=1 Tax=Succinivibrio dextrinosolvens DSM 3072 TaxID=1123324 RepID=A0A1T4VRX2_9GAMM|nr:LacI family DNA-binding transcriptional regulator [Succinivibrio dextrinosolvens]SKA67251.1 transcriptional regulator, LacI family [Succinivibrio dextrinosolvens DSM 3072]